MKPIWLNRKRKRVKVQAPGALHVPEFVWCSESDATYSWMNKELVEFVVQSALEIPLSKWQEDTLDEKCGHGAITEKGAHVFLRTHCWTGPGRTARNEYYIYVDGELIGRFTEVRGDCLDYHYGYTGVEYVCRHVAYEIYEIALERAKPLKEAAAAQRRRERDEAAVRAREQVEEIRKKF